LASEISSRAKVVVLIASSELQVLGLLTCFPHSLTSTYGIIWKVEAKMLKGKLEAIKLSSVPYLFACFFSAFFLLRLEHGRTATQQFECEQKFLIVNFKPRLAEVQWCVWL
jgi:hypothetical protein